VSAGGFDLAVCAELAAIGGVYQYATTRVARWELRRTASFLAGLVVLAICAGPLEAGADERLSAHMLQHLGLFLAAPPLLLWGAPVRLLLASLPARYGRSTVRLLRSRPLRIVLLPAVAVAIFAAAMLATHVPAVYGETLRHPVAHGLEHVLYLTAGLILWTPLIGGVPLPRRLSPLGRILYLMVAMLPGALVGLGLLSATGVVYPFYASVSGTAAALGDQGAAAMVMFGGDVLFLGSAIVILGWRAIVEEEERQRIRDAHDARLRELGGAPGGGA
jgi:cytochrome c oxidase assembly factor CtaG